MNFQPVPVLNAVRADLRWQVYLLGTIEFDAALALQRRLVYQVAGERNTAALVICEHPPGVTVGRHGSWSHIRCDAAELRARHWRVRWVNRGGGCQLHVPGQISIYPILPLDTLGLGLHEYLERLHDVFLALLDDFSIRGEQGAQLTGVWTNDRPIAAVGVAVRDWVSYYGAAFNINPDLEPFRLVHWGGKEGGIMTSLERERRGPLRPTLVRERLIEHFAARFQLCLPSLYFDHPALTRKAPSHASVAAS